MTANDLDFALLRLRAINVRVRVEQLVLRIEAVVVPRSVSLKSTLIGKRVIMTALLDIEDADVLDLLAAGQILSHVYAAASDLMHGRASLSHPPAVVIDDWESAVTRVETLLDRALRSEQVLSPADPPSRLR